MAKALVLYTTDDCHLCAEAERLLERLAAYEPLAIERRDVVDDPEALERLGERIPVLADPMSGRELGWPFDAADVHAFLRQAQEAPC